MKELVDRLLAEPLFADGVETDLASEGITTRAEAYAEGRRDGIRELASALSTPTAGEREEAARWFEKADEHYRTGGMLEWADRCRLAAAALRDRAGRGLTRMVCWVFHWGKFRITEGPCAGTYCLWCGRVREDA